METVLNSFSGILTMFVVVLFGVFIDKKHWVNDNSINFISILVNKVCLPPFMFLTTFSKIDATVVNNMKDGFLLPFASMIFSMLIARMLGHVLKVSRDHLGIFTVCVGLSNTIFVGLPLCIAIFGDSALPYIMTYYFGNSFLFWTIGIQQLASCNDRNIKIFSRTTLKNIASPPLMAALLGFIALLVGVKLPVVLIKGMAYVGNMTTPLAMIFIGIAISKTDFSLFKFDREFFGALLGRFLICPLLLLGMLLYFKTEPLMAEVFLVMSAMPAMANIPIISTNYGGDYKYAAAIVVATTCLAGLVIPMYIMLFHGFSG